MPYITTQAIVLHTADYRDNDRMLSLLTPEHGQLDALCRGCKKPQSPLMSAAQAFSYGEYVLYQAKGRMTVTSFQLIDSFYALREDYGLAQLSRADFEALDPGCVVGSRRTPYGVSAILRRDLAPAGLALEPMSIEDLFILMVKGEES